MMAGLDVRGRTMAGGGFQDIAGSEWRGMEALEALEADTCMIIPGHSFRSDIVSSYQAA